MLPPSPCLGRLTCQVVQNGPKQVIQENQTLTKQKVSWKIFTKSALWLCSFEQSTRRQLLRFVRFVLFVHFPNDTIVQNFRHLFFHVSENLEQSVSHCLTASHYSLIESSKSFKESLNRVWRWSGCCRGSRWIEEVLRANGRSLDCRTKLTMDTMEKDKAKNRRIDKNMKNHEKKKGRSIRSVVYRSLFNSKSQW